MIAELRSSAPSIHTRSKARFGELDVDRAISRAAVMWQGCPVPIPVFSRGRYLGIMEGDPIHGIPSFTPKLYAAPIADTYDGHVTKNAARKQRPCMTWHKRFGAGTANNWYSLYPTTGDPQPGTYGGTARAAKSLTRASAGAMRIGPASSSTRYMRRTSHFPSASAQISGICYVDRVIAYDACTMTASLQSMNNAITATRHISAGQRAMQIFPVADAVHNATAADLSALVYTNQAGTGSRNVPVTGPTLSKILSVAAPTATLGARTIFQCPGSALRSFADPFMRLQSGDLGVRQIDSYTWSAAPTGTVCWELDFPLALCPDGLSVGNATDYEYVSGIDALYGGRVYDDACMTLLAFHINSVDQLLTGMVSFGWT